jgi:hypothetical protein
LKSPPWKWRLQQIHPIPTDEETKTLYPRRALQEVVDEHVQFQKILRARPFIWALQQGRSNEQASTCV